ncbi:MAG: 2,5 ligase [Betaproteobacteria bacterium]|nr:2,5 ligase [Betaproteobacteria bacterium]
MAEQLSFADFEPGGKARAAARRTPAATRKAMKGLFFALRPVPEMRAALSGLGQGLREQHGLEGALLKPENFHMTLHPFRQTEGDWPVEIIEAARVAAASLTQSSFEVAFDRAMSFNRKKATEPLVLVAVDQDQEALLAFQHALGTAMERTGLGQYVERHPTPHLTLLYDRRRIDMQAIEPIGWTAHEFVLIESLTGKSTHVELGCWPLRG